MVRSPIGDVFSSEYEFVRSHPISKSQNSLSACVFSLWVNVVKLLIADIAAIHCQNRRDKSTILSVSYTYSCTATPRS
ncbi:hypothetical protein H6G27_15195 [Nostoc linckia FACHB-104]|nr:hypothetical protein [Nostoc linckia FACHB-104]